VVGGGGGVGGDEAAERGADDVDLGGEGGVGGGEGAVDGVEDLAAAFGEGAAEADGDGDDAVVAAGDVAEVHLVEGRGEVGVEVAADDDQGAVEGAGVGGEVVEDVAGLAEGDGDGGVGGLGGVGAGEGGGEEGEEEEGAWDHGL
jgi:hypothetical protein